MKEKNFQNNINSKSLDELTMELNKVIENLEKETNLENSIEDYQKLIKLNNVIEKKFQSISKNISSETREKISKILKKHD
jgi:exonuclease VII small subunit|tara:strand:+ start:13 stop:252 length:240 start_codon:yes stop_codon:yes gene_type:complete